MALGPARLQARSSCVKIKKKKEECSGQERFEGRSSGSLVQRGLGEGTAEGRCELLTMWQQRGKVEGGVESPNLLKVLGREGDKGELRTGRPDGKEKRKTEASSYGSLVSAKVDADRLFNIYFVTASSDGSLSQQDQTRTKSLATQTLNE